MEATKMIRRLIFHSLLRKLCFVFAASALHHVTIVRTHIYYFHERDELLSHNNNIHDISVEPEIHRDLHILSPTNTNFFLERREQRQIPMFNDTGGIIIFIHIAKTGGSSIREGFKKLPNTAVKRIMNEAQLNGKRDKIDWYLSSSNNKATIKGGREKVLLLEIHGHHGEPMSIFQMHSYIQYWRTKAAVNKKNIFIFTLFRETTAFHLSYFTFFRHPNCQELWCDRPVLAQTEENLMKSMIPNHQCHYLARKFNKTAMNIATLTTPVTESECESVQTLLEQDVDWVGTTDLLSTTTLPLLTYMVAGNASLAKEFPIVNRQNVNKKLQLYNISDYAIQHIRQESNIDQRLCDLARRQYTLDMWSNFVYN
jgi:hypothetical protein